ncbi:hypothetical protein [Pedobacter sp.]|uniref:hypothetical protein n=1 Tax=Pedobacter sp. TaxID=1411316 RepID=UPI00396CF7BB
MKKKVYVLLIIVTAFAIICFSVFYLFKRSILEELEEKNNDIELIWTSLYQKSAKRLFDLDSLSVVNGINCNTDSLRLTILKNKKERNIKDVEALWLLEYNTNKQYLKIEHCYTEKATLKGKLDSLQYDAIELNQIVEKYNIYVKEFNLFYSTFPNFIFAKNGGFKRKKYFYLKFGMDNEALYLEKKKIEKWIETGE